MEHLFLTIPIGIEQIPSDKGGGNLAWFKGLVGRRVMLLPK